MGLLDKLFRRKSTEETIDLDRIPEVTIDDVTPAEMPMGVFRRKEKKVEMVRVTMTMSQSTFEELRRMCSQLNVNASQTMRSAFHHSKPSFWKHPNLISLFDEDLN